MSDLRISVVMPTYNGADRVRSTIQSALDQTYPAHEIIVIDDGSTDATPDLQSIFGDQIRYVRTQNGGQQRARNHGVRLSTGNWIALLDHDDLWDPGYLRAVTDIVRAHDVDVTMANCRMRQDSDGTGIVTNDNRFLRHAPVGYWQRVGADPADGMSVVHRYDYASYLRFHPSQPSLFTIRRSLYEKLGGFDERMRGLGAENFEFELRALRKASVGILWEPLATIVRHGTNASLDGNRMAMDVVDTLEFALLHHGLTVEERKIVEAERQLRLPPAVGGAFALGAFDKALAFQRAYGGRLPAKTRLKTMIARLPSALARRIVGVLH